MSIIFDFATSTTLGTGGEVDFHACDLAQSSWGGAVSGQTHGDHDRGYGNVPHKTHEYL
jgi:hypothetical protein